MKTNSTVWLILFGCQRIFPVDLVTLMLRTLSATIQLRSLEMCDCYYLRSEIDKVDKQQQIAFYQTLGLKGWGSILASDPCVFFSRCIYKTISKKVRSSHAGVSRRTEKIWLYRKRLLPCWHHQEFPISAQQKIPPLPLPWQVQYFLFWKKPNPGSTHSFLPSILNQLWQIGQHKAEPWLHYPPTLIWNECEIIFLFGPAVLQCRPVWCFIYPHLRAQNSVNPLFVFKHLRWLLCVSLSPCWLLWAVCLAGCQWSWSGRRPAVRDDAWFPEMCDFGG